MRVINGIPYPMLGVIGTATNTMAEPYVVDDGDTVTESFVLTLTQAPKDAYLNVVLPGNSVNERDPVQQASFARI